MTTEDFQNGAEALRRRLMAVAEGYLGPSDEAEDIVQDTMVKLWLMREQLTMPVGGMAAVMTRHLCIDHLRRQHPTTDVDRLADEEDVSDDGEQIERMLAIIDSLPSTQRTILRMRHLQGMEMSEIALMLGSTETAVRQTLSRARRAVRRRLMAALAAACILAGMVVMAVHTVWHEPADECVAYVYGQQTTDEAVVMGELRRIVGEVTADDPQQEIERQLNDLLNE